MNGRGNGQTGGTLVTVSLVVLATTGIAAAIIAGALIVASAIERAPANAAAAAASAMGHAFDTRPARGGSDDVSVSKDRDGAIEIHGDIRRSSPK